jgi:hypothetical protein
MLDYNLLACTLAGACVATSVGSFGGYLSSYWEKLRIMPGQVTREAPADRHRIIAAFEVSFGALERQHKKAADFLHLCAFLHNENISVEFICRGLDQDGEWQSPSYGSK